MRGRSRIMQRQDFTPRVTADGSFTFFSDDFEECFHSHYGARQEAEGKFVDPTQVAVLAQQPRLQLLDICYGLGYNSAAALERIWQVNPHCQVELWALEVDPSVCVAAIAHQALHPYARLVQDSLSQLAKHHQVASAGLTAQLLIGDARQTIQTLRSRGVQAQAIFLDPFSPPRCPQLWTVEFFAQIRCCLHPQGRLATYSCAAAVRSGLIAAGFAVGASPPVGRRSPGTLASLGNGMLPSLSRQEEEHLQTRAAVPYRDPTLNDPAAVILERRRFQQQTSALGSTKDWKQRWFVNATVSGHSVS